MTAAALGCPARSVRYPATSTRMAAARIRRFRRASRNRLAPAAGTGGEGRVLDIRLEAITVPGLGQVQVHLQLPAPHPTLRRVPPAAPGQRGGESVLFRGRPPR